MSGASFFVLEGSVGADRRARRGNLRGRAGASLSEVNPPQYPSEAYPEHPF